MNRFGVREVCNVVFRPLTSVDLGGQHFDAGQPMLYIDSAKTSSLEGAATTVYAQGGRGNPRLIGWDGEKTITFAFEDALMSPTSFAMLSGAGLVHGKKGEGTADSEPIYVHATYDMVAEKFDGKTVVKLTDEDRNGATIVVTKEAPVYPVTLDSAGAQANYLSAVTDTQVMVADDEDNPTTLTAATIEKGGAVKAEGKAIYFVLANDTPGDPHQDATVKDGDTVRIDCYEVHYDEAFEMQIDAENFAGYYYIEASTLFRDEETGNDMPAEFVIPRGKIQSNFTFTMANSGDPSTFTFTIDCFPAYTKFNKKKKVMALIQVVDSTDTTHNYKNKNVLGHEGRTKDSDVDQWYKNSVFAQGE